MISKTLYLFLFLFIIVLTPVMAIDLSSSRESSVVDSPYFIMLIVATIGLFVSKSKNIKTLFLVAVIFLLFFALPSINLAIDQLIPETEWQEKLFAEVNLSTELKELTKETRVFDYSDPEIQQIKKDILTTAINEKDAIKTALEYTFINIGYDIRPNLECITSTSSSVLKAGRGDCDIQSILNVGLLRSMGFPARIAGGCFYRDPACSSLFAIQSFAGLSSRQPVSQKIDLDKVDDFFDEELGMYIFPREGGMHAWLEVWTTSDGWLGLESTSGSFIKSGCSNYDLQSYPTDIVNICSSFDISYWKWCGEQNGN